MFAEKFGAAMALVKSDVGGNITVRYSSSTLDILVQCVLSFNQLHCTLSEIFYDHIL